MQFLKQWVRGVFNKWCVYHSPKGFRFAIGVKNLKKSYGIKENKSLKVVRKDVQLFI